MENAELHVATACSLWPGIMEGLTSNRALISRVAEIRGATRPLIAGVQRRVDGLPAAFLKFASLGYSAFALISKLN